MPLEQRWSGGSPRSATALLQSVSGTIRRAALGVTLAVGVVAAGVAHAQDLTPVTPVVADTTPPAAAVPADTAPGPGPGSKQRENYPLQISGPKELVDLVAERTLIGRWRNRLDYDQIQFEGLLARAPDEVQALMRSEGYFSGTVEVSGDPRGVRIDIDAGARTTVNRVIVEVVGPGGAEEPVRDFALQRWALQEGSFFKSEVWEQGKRALVDALRQQGYLRAQVVESRAGIDVENTTAAVAVVIDSGPVIAFGPIQVSGLARYSASLVENLRPFRAGDRYLLDNLLLFQTRLRDSGYFKSASVVPDLAALEADPKATEVPVLVELLEQQRRRLALGIGFSTDNGPRGQIGFEDRNLLERGWRLESALTIEAQRKRLFANVRTPSKEDGTFYGFGGSLERLDIGGELSDNSNLYVGIGRRRAEVEDFVSLQHQAERRLTDQASGTPVKEFITATVLSYAWNLRRLDSSVDPQRGYTISAQVSGARQGWLSDASFARLHARGMRFWPIAAESFVGSGTLVTMLELGAVLADSTKGIPSENLFRTGGAGSVRGYDYLHLGVNDNGATVGGRYLAVASVEFQRPIREGLKGAVFIDVGNAADTLSGLSPAIGIGVGARVKTPVGPINFDLAWGNESKRLRLHFSVGYTF
ncbi:MAG: autotransporter assembly complex protein TamA [Burkholderiaceae bacterium]|nr:autotransporter assembly complex protein TamA [Burkholderiaceae bacterium]